MISGEDDSSSLNGRLRPRKSTATTPHPPSKFSSKSEKVAPDKPKRNSSPSKASPNKNDDLTAKADSSSIAQFLCPLCDKKFTSKVSFKRHIGRLHQLFIKCIYCNYSDASSDDDVMRHMVDNHPNQYVACLICNTRFNTTTELAEHKLTTCEKAKSAYEKFRQKYSSVPQKNQETIKTNETIPVEKKEPKLEPKFNAFVIACELKPSLVHDAVDIEDKITTNLILPSNINNPGMEQNTVLILDDIQWNKRMPPNFSFRNADADQILSRLGVVHRSPRVGESTRKEWLKLMDDSSQKFEKCFDTSFYSRVASNVQENLAKFLDGSFNFSPDPDKIIKTRKSKSSAIINTAEGFPILLPYEQYSRNRFDGYIPRAMAPKHKWKWDGSENEKNMILDANVIKRDNHVDNCIITLVSSLDIWTQLRMRHKFEGVFCKASTEKSEKQNIVCNQLKEILESREIPSTSQAVEQPRSSTTIAVAVTDTRDFPSVLGLAARGSGDTEVGPAPAVLSGEWVRPRCYVCCACGEQSREARALTAHVTAHHPNAQVQHYEIVGESLLNADILKHLYVPPSQMSNRTRPLRGFRNCTKCKKSITMEDMHQHMLDCAGDTPAVRRKCRSRLFGVRKRRPRLPDNPITRKKLRKDLRSRQNPKTRLRARPRIRTEVGDAETIRKMIADLPAKRHRPNEALATQQVLRPRRKLNIPTKKRISSLERPNRKLATNTDLHEPQIIDEDDQPLKPKAKIEPEKYVHTKKRFSTRVVGSRNKEVSTASKELPTSNENRLDVPSGRASQQNRVSRDYTTQRLNINGSNDNGEGDNRSDKNDDDERDKLPGENRDSHKDGVLDPELKHSINSLTAVTTYTESQHKSSPVQTKTDETSSDSRQVFLENEVGSSILDKPPLQKNQRKTSEKKRLSLLNCIEKIKSQQKGDNMFQRPEMIGSNQSDNEHPNLSLLDPHPAVICRTRDESGAANNVIPDNIDYQSFPAPRFLERAPQPIPSETIMYNRVAPYYTNPDLEFTSPNAKPKKRRRKSSAVRLSPGRTEFEQATNLHYSQLLQHRQWNVMHNLPLVQPALLAPQRLPYTDNMLMQLHATEAIKNRYPMQYKSMGFPLPLPYPPSDLLYESRRDNALQRVETGAYPAAPPVSPQTWAREATYMQPFNNEHPITVSLPPKSSNNLLIPIPQRSAKRSSESSDTDYSSAQSLTESIDLRNYSDSTALFMPPKYTSDRGGNYKNKRPMSANEIYNETPDYTNYSADNYRKHFENPNAGEALTKEVQIYQTAHSQTIAASDPYYISPVTAEDRLPIARSANRGDTFNQESHTDSAPKSLYSNNSNKKVFHERYLADHPHISPSVPTESQAAKVTTSTNDSTILESYEMYTHVQNEDDNVQRLQLDPITRLDLNNHTPYIEVGDERDESETLLADPVSNVCEQPLDLSGKAAKVYSAKSNNYEDIDRDASPSTQGFQDVPTDLSLKDNSGLVKSMAHDFQYAEKPRMINQDNATPPIQVAIISQLSCNVNKTIQIAKSDSMSSRKEITSRNNHEEAACVPTVENMKTVDITTIPTQLNLNSEEIVAHQPTDLDREILIARERVRLLEEMKSTLFIKNNDGKQITNINLLNQDGSQNQESTKITFTTNLPTIILPESAPEFNKNATFAGENSKCKGSNLASPNTETANKIALFETNTENLNKNKEPKSQLKEIVPSNLTNDKSAAAISVFPETLIPQKANVTSVNEFTTTLCDASSNRYSSKLTVNTVSLPISSILPKKRHSPSARINSQETQTRIFLNQALMHSNKTEILESEHSTKKIATTSYASESEDITKKSSDIAIQVQYKDETSGKIIDLTEEAMNHTTTKKIEENSGELPVLNITPKPQTIIKHFNEKTASLRAVRIKTSARKSQSEDLQQVSKESYNHIKPLLDIAQRDLGVLPSLNTNDNGTNQIENFNETQQIHIQNTESHDTIKVEFRQSLDKNIKWINEIKAQPKSKEACVIESIEKKNQISDSVTTQFLSVEHVVATEPNITNEEIKETDSENDALQNIDNHSAFMKTSNQKPDDAHNNDRDEIANISNSFMESSLPLLPESSTSFLKEKNLTVLSTEPIAQQSEITKDSIDLCRIDNQPEPEDSTKMSPNQKISTYLKLDNKRESDEGDVMSSSDECLTLASIVKNIADKKQRQKKTSKKISFNKKKQKKTSKMDYYKSRSINSKLHKKQTEAIFKITEPQNGNSKISRTAQDALEIKTVKVDSKIQINMKTISEKPPDHIERDSDNTEENNSEKQKDSNDVHKNKLAKNLDRSPHLHIFSQESDDVSSIKSNEDITTTVNDAESLQKRNSTPTHEYSGDPVNNFSDQLENKNDEFKINDATLITDDNSNVKEIDPILDQIVPVTKKQLIFSKLLHEENKQVETKQNLVLHTTNNDDDVEIATETKIATKRKKSSKKSKNKKRKSFDAIEKDELCKIDTKYANISPKRKRKSSSPNKGDENISKVKKSNLANTTDDVTFTPHLDSTSYDNSVHKVTNGAEPDMTESTIDTSKEFQNQPEKSNTSAEIRTACYNRPINKLTNFASEHVKNPKNYDPYDIDLEIDMAETKRPVIKRKSNRTVSGNNYTKTTKKNFAHGDLDEKLRHDTPKVALVVSTINDSDSSISDTPLQKYVEEKNKSKIEALKSPDGKKPEKDISISVLLNTTDDDNMVLSELPPTEEQNLNNNNDETILEMNLEIECNTNIATNSIDHSVKTNEAEINEAELNEAEINEVVASVKDFIAEQKNISEDNQDNDQTNTVPESKKSNTKQKKNLRSQSAGKNEENSEKSHLQLSSDKYMENFGFFSFRQPRNANLLATKKISETYNMIENDDVDFRPRERQRKHSHNESRKVLANGAHSSKTTQEINSAINRNISVVPSTSALNITETNTMNEPNPAVNDGEVDLITAQRMLESEEIRQLERDLYFGFKEAAEANAGKTSGFNYLRAEETRIENVNQNIVDPVDTHDDTDHVESREPASPDKRESEERPESPEIPESPEGVLIDKPLMYPEEEVNIYEDKYDIIKRRREASANAKQLLKVEKPKKSNNGIRKKKPDNKTKRSSKKPVYQVSQVRTKGALKGFDGIKISIATQDLNMPPSVSPPYLNGSKNQKQKESTGKARPLSASSIKSDADPRAAAVAQPDIYEFQDDERPVAKGYRLSRATRTISRDKSRSSSSECEEKKSKSNQYGKEKFTLPHGKGNHVKKSDKPKGSDKKKYKRKGKGKRKRNKDDDSDDETPREEAKRVRKDKSKNYKGCDKNKVAEPENKQTADVTLAEDGFIPNNNNASTVDNDEPFYDSEIEMPNVTGTSGFVPDRNDESSYDSDSSSPPLSSVLKGPYACTCLSEIDSDDSETERGCAHRSCRYSHLNAAKNAVMGKIFKNNAVRCEKIDEKPESPQPKPDLDRLFDSLLEPTNDVASTSTIVPIAGTSSSNLFYYTTTQVNSQSQINKSLQEKKIYNFDDGSNSFYSTKDVERTSMSTSVFETDKLKIDDASNIYNFSENTEESTDNGRYVMVSEKPVQTEDPEQLARPEIAQDGPDDVEPESSDFIVLKKKNNAQKSRGTQTKRFSNSDAETSSHDGESKISKKNLKANKKHKSHHKRDKSSEDEKKHKPSRRKTTSAKPHSSKTKQANKPTKTNSRGRRPSQKPSTSKTSDEGTIQDNSANASGSPLQRTAQEGIAEGRARRKCTVGKQNVLAEHWSSSDSDSDAPSRFKGRKSSVVKKTARGKKVCKRSQGEVEERPRAPVLKLRARTVTSLNNRARLRGREERHGWIVGHSGKKLVSMLAYNKMLQQLRRKRLRLQRQRGRRRRRRERERKEEEEREKEEAERDREKEEERDREKEEEGKLEEEEDWVMEREKDEDKKREEQDKKQEADEDKEQEEDEDKGQEEDEHKEQDENKNWEADEDEEKDDDKEEDKDMKRKEQDKECVEDENKNQEEDDEEEEGDEEEDDQDREEENEDDEEDEEEARPDTVVHEHHDDDDDNVDNEEQFD